jgi:hypothetical protein
MDVSLRVADSDRLMRRLNKIAADTGVEIGFICRDQMRLWLNDIIRYTPAKNLKQARAAVAKDVGQLFFPMDNKSAIQAWKDQAIKDGGDIFTVTKRGKRRISQKKLKVESVNRMHRIHKANRTKKGRVDRRRLDKSEAWGGEFMVPRQQYRKFLSEVQSKVGLLKSRFGKAATYYARLTNGRNAADKRWISRHTDGGSYKDNMGKSGSGLIRSVNDANYAAAKMLGASWWKSVQSRQQRALARGGAKRMDDLARRFNMGSAA